MASEEVGVPQFRSRSRRRPDDMNSSNESKTITAAACTGEVLATKEHFGHPGKGSPDSPATSARLTPGDVKLRRMCKKYAASKEYSL